MDNSLIHQEISNLSQSNDITSSKFKIQDTNQVSKFKIEDPLQNSF